jgi:hypothetical protein
MLSAFRVTLQAVNYVQVREFTKKCCWASGFNLDCLVILTLEGIMEARSGDWILKGLNGEFYLSDCASCPIRSRWCPNTSVRKIARGVHERAHRCSARPRHDTGLQTVAQ